MVGAFRKSALFDVGLYSPEMATEDMESYVATYQALKREYGLRVLSMTFDHGFMSPQALANIKHAPQQKNFDNAAGGGDGQGRDQQAQRQQAILPQKFPQLPQWLAGGFFQGSCQFG